MYTYSVQAMHEPPMEHLLLKPLDNDGNNIAHLAAQEGIVSVFKVKLRTGLSESFIWILSLYRLPSQEYIQSLTLTFYERRTVMEKLLSNWPLKQEMLRKHFSTALTSCRHV